MKIQTFLLSLSILTSTAYAQEKPPGQVQLPLDTYMNLLQGDARPAPAGYAIGNAQVSVRVTETEQRATAEIRVELDIQALEDEWVLVPVLPSGTPVESVTIGGQPAQLLATPQGLAWSTKKSGAYKMNLLYRVDAGRFDNGLTLPVPVPAASAIKLVAVLPGTGLDVTVIPAAGIRQTSSGNTTQVSATIPTTSGLQISWRTPGPRGHTISRASYSGRLVGGALVWKGTLDVELFDNGTITLPLLPQSVTLSDLMVDGKKAPIMLEDSHFVTLVSGRGAHRIHIELEVPVVRQDGHPKAALQIPQVPVSRFELTLPGRKELEVVPNASVQTKTQGKNTVATANVPMTNQVSFMWSEAVPEDIRAELRANASLYHTLSAEEGVLNGRVAVVYEVKRGETNVVDLTVPADVQVNRVTSDSGALSDWRMNPARQGGPRTVTVFLNRQLQGELLFDLFYDRSLSRESEGIDAPLFQAVGVQRQKGMLALLASRDIALAPVAEPEESGITRVGENQLPEYVRESIDLTVAHTFKYADLAPELTVAATTPERVQGKFDAEVDTLVTLADVTMTGSASIEVHVKSGTVMELELELPGEANLLNLTAPSLRTHQVQSEEDPQIVAVEFTQEMEGDFRIELTYERILQDEASAVDVPSIRVRGAEVEQGRIAVEARSAVEIRPSVTDELSPLDVNELPRQLVLRAANPILLAYKYVHADPPHRLALDVKRHRVLGTQEAVIDNAEYQTLFTRDGLFVTMAHFMVRNARKQFLRVELPEGSEVWSVFVDGKSEQPALSNEDGDTDESTQSAVLIKILNSSRGFPVQVVYATPGSPIRWLGKLEEFLPRPDILATTTRWDVYLPADMRYAEPVSNMDLVVAGQRVQAKDMNEELARLQQATGANEPIGPLHINVPTSGVRYAFKKLYANQAGETAWFSIRYATAGGAATGQAANFFGVFLFWAGMWFWWRQDPRIKLRVAQTMCIIGLLILILAIGVFHVSSTPPFVISMIASIAFLAIYGRKHLAQWRRPTTEAGTSG